MRAIGLRLAAGLAILALALGPARAAPGESFTRFLRLFEAQAVAAGVSPNVYRRATQGLTPDPKIPALVTSQPEFSTPIWAYLDKRVSPARVRRGRAAMAAHAALFSVTGKRYGVDPDILAAIWGLETDYGAVLDNHALIRPVVRSLATLTYEKRGRVEADAAEFIAALKLVQRGPLDANELVGSWAGAIGNLQVNPSTVLKFGTDADGDGRIDLQHSLADALATSAKFLLSLGYQPGLDWGYEVNVPKGFDYLLATRTQLRPIRFFVEHGIGRVAGRRFSNLDTPVFLYVPAGRTGPKFLMTKNYLVLKGYNFSDSYALAVGHLADRLKGAGEFVAPWPRATKFPDTAQRVAMQRALSALGLYDGTIDGRLGPQSQRAYATFQARHGEPADGFLTLAAYEALARVPK